MFYVCCRVARSVCRHLFWKQLTRKEGSIHITSPIKTPPKKIGQEYFQHRTYPGCIQLVSTLKYGLTPHGIQGVVKILQVDVGSLTRGVGGVQYGVIVERPLSKVCKLSNEFT